MKNLSGSAHKVHRLGDVDSGTYTYRGEEIYRNDGIPSSTYGRWVWRNTPFTYRWEITESIDRTLIHTLTTGDSNERVSND